jgi:hypothetical protein
MHALSSFGSNGYLPSGNLQVFFENLYCLKIHLSCPKMMTGLMLVGLCTDNDTPKSGLIGSFQNNYDYQHEIQAYSSLNCLHIFIHSYLDIKPYS